MSTTPAIVTFSINVTGEETGKAYPGLFKTKVRLSHADQLRQDEMRRELLGKNAEYASPRALNQAEVFSYIWVHLTESPQWWGAHRNGLDLEDDNVLGEIHDNIVKARAEYREKLKAEAEAARQELTKDLKKAE